MLDSDWLMAKLVKTPWLDWMILISARLNSISILIFFHVKNIWLISLLFLFIFFQFLRLFNSSYLKIWYIFNLPFNFSLLLRCRHLIETKELHVLNVAENTLAYTYQDIEEPLVFWSDLTVTFILIAARNSLIISRRSIVSKRLNYVLSSLQTHFKRRYNY